MKKTFTFLAILILLCNLGYSQVYDTIVGWTFPSGTATDLTANMGIAANLTQTLSTKGGTGTVSVNAMGGLAAARASGWDNGADTKYWEVLFSTVGYDSLYFTSTQRSSGNQGGGPRNFKVQYRVGLLGTWTDVPYLVDTVNTTWTNALTDSLPTACNEKDSVFLRWIMTDNISVNGTTVTSGGSTSIRNIKIWGHNISGLIAPIVTDAYINNGSEVTVVFSRPVSATAETTTNYTGLGNITSAVRSTLKDTVTLTLETALIDGNAYTLTIADVQDTLNTPMAIPQSFDFLFNNTVSPLVITEIFYNNPSYADPSDSLEFIEIYNNSDAAALVGAYAITGIYKGNNNQTVTSSLFTFPVGYSIDPHQYIVIAKDTTATNAYFNVSNTLQWKPAQSLNNTWETLIIKNTTGSTIDSVSYLSYNPDAVWPTEDTTIAASLTLCDYELDNALGTNWSYSIPAEYVDSLNNTPIYATPGAPCTTPESINNIKTNEFTVGIYPNPNTGIFSIERTSASPMAIRIYDAIGNKIMEDTSSKSNTVINLSNIEKGLYVISITDLAAQKTTQQKLIITK